ncbi:archaemetzincin [Flavobacterium sp.]|uniref:archaemetzincin n=1 Tax=Flavobacterium sp. TaxID=239 RepID=UPI0039E28EBA
MKRYLLLLAIVCLSCQPQPRDYFDHVAPNDLKMPKPKPGEWLDSHHESGQNLMMFKLSNPLVPNDSVNMIHIKPIGIFNALQQKQLDLTCEYLSLFFQLNTEIGSEIPESAIPESARRIGLEGHEQMLAGYILDSLLKKEKPPKAIAVMGLSKFDLYPKPEWNYVFGLASYQDHVGVSSIFRFQDGQLTEANFNLCLLRLIKVSSHEIGHMFGLHHCIDAQCVMNGTNNINETDQNPVRLCSYCQRKLHSSLQYDHRKRLLDLEAFFKRNKLEEAADLMRKDLDAI